MNKINIKFAHKNIYVTIYPSITKISFLKFRNITFLINDVGVEFELKSLGELTYILITRLNRLG